MSSSMMSEASSKVGRHRLYSNEQRKDRNRKAQAAFRVRRNKYTETLELAATKNEKTIEDLKSANEKNIQRAEVAEQRCVQLDSQVASLEKLLQAALAENERIAQNKIPDTSSTSDVSVASSDVFAAKWLEEMNHNHGLYSYIFTDNYQNEFCLGK
ncbi:hypothetical protein INT48_006059 [Thamnidium elegans]|uniref:BZIP domain-containing protein n=1 Tax=Thamnidium elegans TaxID=101142 RepID=A0A8H7SPC8_9FUNG|nr:hypothetical protein INT48_006059 [Thamnidium elegans]